MKKEKGKIILSIGIILLVFLTTFCFIHLESEKKEQQNMWKKDQQNLQEPTENKENIPEQALEELPQEYSMEQAIQDGCFVITYQGLYNVEKMEQFIENTKIEAPNRIANKIRIMQYTVEGDPIITELSYQIQKETYLFSGKEVPRTNYEVKKDFTRDKFAAEEDRKIVTNADIPGEIYTITKEIQQDRIEISLRLCAEVSYVSDAKTYQDIPICSYPSKFVAKEE